MDPDCKPLTSPKKRIEKTGYESPKNIPMKNDRKNQHTSMLLNIIISTSLFIILRLACAEAEECLFSRIVCRLNRAGGWILNKQKVPLADGFIISSYFITASEAKIKHYSAAFCN